MSCLAGGLVVRDRVVKFMLTSYLMCGQELHEEKGGFNSKKYVDGLNCEKNGALGRKE